MRTLQRWAISRPIATTMFYLAVVLLGWISFRDLELNLLPDLEFPRLTIITRYANASPEEIENLITRPITESVGTVSGLRKVSSESIEGVSFVYLQFDWATKIDFAAMEVREKTDLIRNLLPEDASKPIVSRHDPAKGAFIELVFFPKDLSRPKDLRHFLEREVKTHLDRIDGVAMARFSGGYRREVQVEIDQARAAAHGQGLLGILQILDAANINFPAGHIRSGNTDVLIRTLGEFRTVADIGATAVGYGEAGTPVRLREIASIADGYRDRTGLARYNQTECVVVSLFREPGKNTVRTAEHVRAAVAGIRTRFGRELEVRIVYDESTYIERSISNLLQALLMGAGLAFVALVLILRNYRSPLILLTVVPVSILATCILMRFRGISLNMMSLGGLELGLGMLFDSGNIVLASIERQSRLALPPREAAMKGAGEVAGSITSAVLTTVVVFLPVVFLQGVVGVVFAEMALTVTFSLLVSLVVSLTLIPMLASLRPHQDSRRQGRLFTRAEEAEKRALGAYSRRLEGVLRAPARSIALALVLVAFGVLCTSFVEREFVPKVDTGEFTIQIRSPKGTPLEASANIVSRVEEALRTEQAVQHVISMIGYDEDDVFSRKGGDFGTHRATIRVILKDDRSQPTGTILESVRKRVQLRPEIATDFVMTGDIIRSILSPDAQPIALEIKGPGLETLDDLGGQIKRGLGTIRGVVDVRTSMEQRTREYHVRFDDPRMADFRLSRDQVAQHLRTAIKGSIASRLRVGEEEIDIRVRLRAADRTSAVQVLESKVITEAGSIALKQVAAVEEQPGYGSVLRSGPERVNRVTAEIVGRSRNGVFSDLEDYIGRLRLPAGYSVQFAGERDDIQASFRELGLSFILAAVLIYMLLSAQVESLRLPLLMMGTIPAILIGVGPALLATGKSLNVNSFIGVILLIGIVVDNAVLLYEYIEILLGEGMRLREAILESGRIVFRPVIMNNATTIFGMLPIALELGRGTEFQSPMAIAVIAGLLSSVIISLFLMPGIFYLVMKRQAAHS